MSKKAGGRKSKAAFSSKVKSYERLISKYSSSLRFAVDPRVELYRIKNYQSSDEIFSIFPKLFGSSKYIELAHGPAFPKKIEEIFSSPPLFSPASRTNEVVWSICRCLQYGAEIKEFVRLERSLECLVLLDDQAGAEEVLKEIERRFGLSTWLLQAKLAAAQNWEGFEGAEKVELEYAESLKNNQLINIIFWFAKKRIEATSIKDYLEGELDRVAGKFEIESLEKYLSCKIFNQYEMPSDCMAALLFYEAQNGVVDLYEALIAVLQAAASHNAFVDPAWRSLERPILMLYQKTLDPRMHGVVRVLGGEALIEDLNRSRSIVIESYTAGKFEECIRFADVILEEVPDDMHVLMLKIKSQVKMGAVVDDNSMLGYIFNNLSEVLRFTEKAYTSAHALFTLAGRFYGMAWASYLKSFVMYNLAAEKSSSPSFWFRDLIIKDFYITPFTLLTCPSGMALGSEFYKTLEEAYPNTLQLFYASILGKEPEDGEIQQFQLRTQIARHHLMEKHGEEALASYKWLLDHSISYERLRYAGGLVLAHIVVGDVSNACEALVSAFLENSNSPSILPLAEVVDALKDPVAWPNSIFVPLALAIYIEYYPNDRLADLRYAFEKFQVDNGIETPEDLVLLLRQHPNPVLVSYMDKVWRPEVMRQTLLYDGSKAIEEARIKVCQKLVEVDPSNSKKYLEEIKERVKQLEIAKGMTLVEKSKVYVDIEAIKKALRSKLGDTYSRYKALSPSIPNSRDEIIEKISTIFIDNYKGGEKSLASILSGLHILDGSRASETDAQFDALFSEVTNEFLKGAHGLNAYLSTRVRHGTLSSTLRKPVEDEKLVTTKEEGRETYTPNDFWVVDAVTEGLCEVGLELELKDALNSFAENFDEILDYIKDQLLQVKIVHQISEPADGAKALFVYRSSNLERKLAQVEDRGLKDIDQFIERCVDTLWEKTDENLENVQQALRGEIKDRIQVAFDQLTERLAKLPAVPIVNDVLNAIGRAKTNTRIKLDVVTSWFKRSEVYDRQDFTVDFPIQIAINMIKNTMSVASDWDGVTIVVDPKSKLMPGRTLDGMVYVFYGLIENAINHSKLPVFELSAKAELSYINGQYVARFSNRVNMAKKGDDDLRRVEQIRESMLLKESTKRAQAERYSGLHKIWLTANGPVHRDPSLEFDWVEDEFVVTLKFRLDWS